MPRDLCRTRFPVRSRGFRIDRLRRKHRSMYTDLHDTYKGSRLHKFEIDLKKYTACPSEIK